MTARPAAAVRDRQGPVAAWAEGTNGTVQLARPGERAPSAPPDRGAVLAATARAASDAPRSSWWRAVLRVARDAALGLAFLAMIPLWNVARHGDAAWRTPGEYLVQRLSNAESLRGHMLPRDGTLTPAEAGRAFRSLEIPGGTRAFPMTRIEDPLRRRWRGLAYSRGEFAGLPRTDGPVPHPSRLIQVAAAGVSARELELLRTVAESPLWTVIDPLVRAPAADLVGTRFILPFRADASPIDLPAVKRLATMDVAVAGMWRIAYHVARGDRARAEYAARVVISYGFFLIDNGTQDIDGFVGATLVESGYRGPVELKALTAAATDERLPALPPRDPPLSAFYRPPLPPRKTEATLRALAGDATRPRTLRLAALQQLSMGTCGSVRGVLFGHSARTRAIFDEAARSLARFPEEAALVELLREAPSRPVPALRSSHPFGVLLGSARLAATVSGNQRFETCPLLLRTPR